MAPTASEGIDAGAVRGWFAAAVRDLEQQCAAIDAVNVYPVADADTGTNLLHTARAGFEALLRSEPADAAAALRAVAGGALVGARGNSGVLLSQTLRGFADAVPAGAPSLHAEHLAAALHRGRELAAAAVSEPVPGTMLSVLEALAAAAKDAGDAGDGGDLAELTGALVSEGTRALRATRDQLDALSAAGVVDAGGHGLMVLVVALHNVLNPADEAWLPPPGPGSRAVHPRGAETLRTARERGSAGYQYEVMYLLRDVHPEPLAALPGVLAGLGDSVSVVDDGAGLHTVHVHCDDVGAAVEAGLDAGRPYRVTVARFADQVTGPSGFAAERAVVTLARGPGVAALFGAEGAAVLTIAAGAEPTASDVLAVIAGTGAATVTVLAGEPELAELIDTGAAAARHAGQAVTVIPTMSPVQSLTALAVHDPNRRAEDDVVAMAEAAAATRRGALVIAEQEALTFAGRCAPGDVLGMVDGEVLFIRPTVAAAADDLVSRMLAAGGELVTVLLGAQAGSDLGPRLRERARAEHPEVDVTVYTGDQHDAVLVLGVE